ncbi:MAG TPA: hypothetical protein DGU45_03310 [Planctomycetes bacterium]|nr:hypothetical protein [Planctomycetota bacterium]
MTETITKCQQKKKKKSFFKFLSGGGGDPDEEEEQFEVVPAGKFKGILKVYNEQEYLNEKEKLFDQVLKIQQLFKECYDLELAPMGKKWDLDLDGLHPDKIESYFKMKADLSIMKDLLTAGGLGSLKLEKKVAKFLYDAQLQKKLEKNVSCKV